MLCPSNLTGSALIQTVTPAVLAEDPPCVFVIDDDICVREALERLIRSTCWRSETFASAQAFLARKRETAPSCLILDVNLPDLNGLELQRRLAIDQGHMPIIFLTGSSDVATGVQAMKAGAIEFLTKPFDRDVLLDAVDDALDRSRIAMSRASKLQALQERYAMLSLREREVMTLVVQGLLNKQVGYELGISEVTVKVHRGKVMRKMEARSFAELVTMVASLQFEPRTQDAIGPGKDRPPVRDGL